MTFCQGCGTAFCDDDVELFDPGTGETWDCCPTCGCDELEPAVKCAACEEYTAETEMEHNLCDECRMEADRIFSRAMDAIRDDLTIDQLMYLDETVNDIWFAPAGAYKQAS